MYRSHLSFDDRSLSLLLIAGAVSNSVSRILVGILMVRVSFKRIYTIHISIIIVSSITFVPSTLYFESKLLGTVYLMIGFAGLGTMVTMFPVVCVNAFGVEVGRRVYPFVYVCFSVSSMMAYGVYRGVKRLDVVYFIITCISIVGMYVVVLFDERPCWNDII